MRPAHIGGGHRIGLKTGEAERATLPCTLPRIPCDQQVQTGAKPKLCNIKPLTEPRGQIIAAQKDVFRLCDAVLKAEEWIVKAGRQRHPPRGMVRAPFNLICLVLHAHTA